VKRWADPAKTSFKILMPVYILTSRSTFSGGEDFTYGMKCARRAVIVGDTTGGGAHPTRPFSIGQGFIVEIPTHRSPNIATQTDWEGSGVWPDIAVASQQALAKAQGLIFAELLANATNEQEKQKWQWNITSMENKARLAKQVSDDSIKISEAMLAEYCGEYSGTGLITISIVPNGKYLARRLNIGAEDIRLIPIARNKFVYDDDSGRTVEFVTNLKEEVSAMMLTTQEGTFTRSKTR
jgi:hypothetical protein